MSFLLHALELAKSIYESDEGEHHAHSHDTGTKVQGTLELTAGAAGLGSLGAAGIGTGLTALGFGGAGSAALGTAAVLGPAGMIAGAGALGYGVGSAIDKKLQLSDRISGTMPAQLDNHYREAGVEPQAHRGAAGIAAVERQQQRLDPATYYTEQTRREVVRAREQALGHYGQ